VLPSFWKPDYRPKMRTRLSTHRLVQDVFGRYSDAQKFNAGVEKVRREVRLIAVELMSHPSFSQGRHWFSTT